MHCHGEIGLLVGEGGDDLSGLCIPVLDVLVVGNAVEPPPIVGEIDVANTLIVTHVGAQALPLVVIVPDLASAIHTRRQDEMGCLGKPPDLVDTHRVARPSVHPLLREEALLVVDVFDDLGGLVLDPRAPCVVRLLRPVEDRSDPLLRFPLLAFHSPLFLTLSRHLVFAEAQVLIDLLLNSGAVLEASPSVGSFLCDVVHFFLVDFS
mmetsp:Transcript_57548/g.122401  ORF Transcript_57548/g.122401 Transcript_57548/m.122401 type:complete len:207 (-) Transcript_57548:821-1441(-)